MSLITDPILIQTYEDYLSIVGVAFVGVYHGNWTLQRNGKMEIYSVISLRFDPREISPVLLSIATSDHAHRVWKAMTGPNQDHPQSDYRLWTSTPLHNAKHGQCQTYKITGVSCFTDDITLCNCNYNGGIELYIEICD